MREILKTSKPKRNNMSSKYSGKRIFARMNGFSENFFNTVYTS